MRRGLCMAAAVSLLLVAAPVRAAEPAAPGLKTVPLAKVFPYLGAYQKLPAAERSLFAPTYTLGRDGRPASGLKAWMLHADGKREPLPVGADGRVQRLPTAAELASDKVVIDVPATAKIGIRLGEVALIRPAAEMDAAEVARAIRQADAGGRKLAGLFAAAAPKIARAVFVGAGAGTAALADGRIVALPGGETPFYDPVQLPGAKTLKLNRAPSSIDLDTAAKR